VDVHPLRALRTSIASACVFFEVEEVSDAGRVGDLFLIGTRVHGLSRIRGQHYG